MNFGRCLSNVCIGCECVDHWLIGINVLGNLHSSYSWTIRNGVRMSKKTRKQVHKYVLKKQLELLMTSTSKDCEAIFYSPFFFHNLSTLIDSNDAYTMRTTLNSIFSVWNNKYEYWH